MLRLAILQLLCGEETVHDVRSLLLNNVLIFGSSSHGQYFHRWKKASRIDRWGSTTEARVLIPAALITVVLITMPLGEEGFGGQLPMKLEHRPWNSIAEFKSPSALHQLCDMDSASSLGKWESY